MEMLARHQTSIDSLGEHEQRNSHQNMENAYQHPRPQLRLEQSHGYGLRREGNLSMSQNALKPVYANAGSLINNLTPLNMSKLTTSNQKLMQASSKQSLTKSFGPLKPKSKPKFIAATHAKTKVVSRNIPVKTHQSL